ncbi:MAG: 2Fe-2S iron-sulfur cluster binding domain-containing protein [Candidatus Thiodiazotropha sp. (ex Epidulcina cf. delphinae)]|nr:2Fe-2S iron-sulfur cluster binding domain-containing protein [Candidatus Thiodiazotropha sp. (ex Epidulcina cf. delphinae)]
MTSETLALVIFTAILMQLVILLLVGLYRRRLQYRGLNEPTAEADGMSVPPHAGALPATEPIISAPAWTEFREFFVQRREMEDENGDICSFYLAPVDGMPLPAYKPGQFLTFKLQIDDPDAKATKTLVRCYSLSDRPRPDHYRVSIKRVRPPADQPQLAPGISSNFFHDHVPEGDRLLIKPPSGRFHLMEDAPLPIVLIGGGIGITPMLSMLNTLLESSAQRVVWLFYGVRNRKDQIMKRHLQVLAKAHANFHLHVCYSNPTKEDKEGIDYQHSGRIGISLLRSTLKLMRYQFYVCGPKPMMEEMVQGLKGWGVDSNDIYFESFGVTAPFQHHRPDQTSANTAAMNVTFNRSDKTLTWDSAADSLLEFAETNGVEVTSCCRAGSCGSCQTPIASGEVEYHQQPTVDVEDGYCLLCISRPKSDLVLEV